MLKSLWTRRKFVVAATAGGTLAPTLAVSATLPDPAADPRKSNVGIVKLAASLGPEPAPWWFSGILYAQQGDNKPVPFVRCEGCEQYRMEPQGDGSYVERGDTLTFFRHVETREWLDHFDNPITGKRVEVHPNVLQRGAGGLVYPPDGSAPYFSGKLGNMGQLNYKPPDATADKEPDPPAHPRAGELSWQIVGDTVLLTTSRAVDTPAQPWVETSTMMTTRAAFFDPHTRSTPGNGMATYLSPWLKWMQMDGVPGHLVWHAPSVKLRAIAALPTEYRTRALQMNLLKVLE